MSFRLSLDTEPRAYRPHRLAEYRLKVTNDICQIKEGPCIFWVGMITGVLIWKCWLTHADLDLRHLIKCRELFHSPMSCHYREWFQHVPPPTQNTARYRQSSNTDNATCTSHSTLLTVK